MKISGTTSLFIHIKKEHDEQDRLRRQDRLKDDVTMTSNEHLRIWAVSSKYGGAHVDLFPIDLYLAAEGDPTHPVFF